MLGQYSTVRYSEFYNIQNTYQHKYKIIPILGYRFDIFSKLILMCHNIVVCF